MTLIDVGVGAVFKHIDKARLVVSSLVKPTGRTGDFASLNYLLIK